MNPALLSDSPTVATLNARAELRTIRMIFGSHPELDRLEDLLSDALHMDDDELSALGWISEDVLAKNFVPNDDYKQMRQGCEDAEAGRDKAEARIRELEDALDESEDESKKHLAEALAECARLRAVAEKATAQRDELRKTTAAQQLTQRVRDALFPLPRGAKGKAAEAYERLTAAVRKALEVQP